VPWQERPQYIPLMPSSTVAGLWEEEGTTTGRGY